MKARGMTLEEFKGLKPCWLEDPGKSALLDKIGSRKERWTALDVLGLPEEEVSDEDKLCAVLREEFIPPAILHEFACRCAEEALKLVKDPDPRSIAAIEAKRKWLRGEISDKELAAARDAAWAASDAAWYAARAAAWYAALAAAWYAAWDAAWYAARAATRAATLAATLDATWDAARKNQIEMLKGLLQEEGG